LWGRIIKGKEILNWLINGHLLLSLLGNSLIQVEDLHVVFGIDFDSNTLGVSFVKNLLDTLVVILHKSSLLVELDGGFRKIG
tara:strand:+ start:267 stop:512 length:246 start_codon:yes stop_codon:yes gene_type:complete